MNRLTIYWHNKYSRTVEYSDLAEAIVDVYIDTYQEIPTIEDLKEFIWKDEYLYDYTEDLLEYLFPDDVDSNCLYTELSDLEIEDKDKFCEYLEIAIKNITQHKTESNE